MITTIEQALAVQTRRHKSGKRGFSKSVRRFYKRTGGQAKASGLPHTFARPANPNTNPST
ncbi:MAG TPA: hypothetical protein VGE88_19070 [Lysobacter sp.]